MPVLEVAREELFARELVELELAGEDHARVKAYRKVYGPGRSSEISNARKFANKKHIKQRRSELFREALEYRDVRVASVVTRIDRVGRANIVDFFEPTLGIDGKPTGTYRLKDITALPRELSEALHSIEWDDAGRPKIKLHDKNQANFTLLKHFGGLPEEAADHRTVNIFAGLSVDAQRTILEALEAIPAGSGVVEGEAA